VQISKQTIIKYRIVIAIAFFLALVIKPALCFLFFGSMGLYLGFKSVRFLTKLRRKGIECTGTILAYNSDEEGFKTPLVEFFPADGSKIASEPYIYASSDLSKFRSFKDKINQPVTIVYDPDDPKKFILEEDDEMNYFFLIILFLVSIVFSSVGISSLLGFIHL
jgi:Protein of unknown function (DUF3592)